ncbi:MAG: DUF4193 family protein [Acidimicrobiia bacterium]
MARSKPSKPPEDPHRLEEAAEEEPDEEWLNMDEADLLEDKEDLVEEDNLTEADDLQPDEQEDEQPDEQEDEQEEPLDELEAEELDMLTEDEEAEVLRVDEVAELRQLRREEIALDSDVESAKQDEFVCSSCFLVKRTSQLADRRRMRCRDCAA